MTDYTIKVEGYETGLVRGAVIAQIQEMFPNAESVTVIEEE